MVDHFNLFLQGFLAGFRQLAAAIADVGIEEDWLESADLI